jgi:hypothetical protein
MAEPKEALDVRIPPLQNPRGAWRADARFDG